MTRAALAILAVLALSGCATLGIPSGTPEERAHRALDKFVADLTGAPGGAGLQTLAGTVSAQGYSVPFSIDFYRDGTRHANLSTAGFAFDVYCAPGGATVRIVAGVPTESRGGCPLESGRFGATGNLIKQLTLLSASSHNVEVTAVFGSNSTDPIAQSAGNLTIRTDGADRVRHLDMTSPGGNLSANASYDPRANRHAPTPLARQPVAARNHTDLYEGTFSWEARDASATPPLGDIEVRVNDSTTHETLATFGAADASGNASGFAFAYEDRDRDGNFSENDRFTLHHENWTSERQYEVTVWDAWAGAPVVRANGVPAPGVVIVGLAIALALASAGAGHSRQRG